ncbi:glycerophosphodiester phosphodiesterase [Paenibacillus sp. 19GGS1-52]|uniref:phosphatidylinositol-specific phospholipase C/glycerophosphodiester phosphodiesterase family protein n=1 Tax=Paenibacillus sp. 19GGS1-52 TaxID=2758563 RepID=UPI001EFA4351|nr:phosphatidylinositol-specific phospholipase C/glycerophosphodiester phosphodiesterase family protein [Paenibacillus sp. 19GGS1-52]ULO04743.1 glycerophosphodiester phosphodiesterase [Paenibacillus sp. 19GGS1-52]
MVKKKVFLSLLIAIVLIWCDWGLVLFGKENQATDSHSSNWEENEFIAHALGGIDGSIYTNSYDAFISNYHRGYRLFEVDLLQTGKGEFIARHDWSQKLQPDLSDQKSHMFTMSQFENSLILGKFQPLALNDILHLMQEYPDFNLIIDTKANNKESIQYQFEYLVNEAIRTDASLLERIIPEIFNPEMYDAVMKIYPFPNKIYSLYKSNNSAASIVKFVQDNHISVVAMPTLRAFINPNLVHTLNKIGVKSYVHTVNNIVMMKLLQSMGVHGFYTDQEVSPNVLAQTTAKPINVIFHEYSSTRLESIINISNLILKVKQHGYK